MTKIPLHHSLSLVLMRIHTIIDNGFHSHRGHGTIKLACPLKLKPKLKEHKQGGHDKNDLSLIQVEHHARAAEPPREGTWKPTGIHGSTKMYRDVQRYTGIYTNGQSKAGEEERQRVGAQVLAV